MDLLKLFLATYSVFKSASAFEKATECLVPLLLKVVGNFEVFDYALPIGFYGAANADFLGVLNFIDLWEPWGDYIGLL